ncbi:four-carbon acid sugar kinase family protein [Aquiflexum sp.]|uniref:four-carbon acid sugar kinase family protein n=1 Tax=Aquiflexum sp. TaxID=1872584 RepID=UPI0035945866
MKDNLDILLGYYGDDFTGSADVMEVLSLMGIPTVLFLNAPDQNEIDRFVFKNRAFPDFKVQAFGVAGIARSLAPLEMKEELEPIFQNMRKIPFRYFHYKICSTLDSSPEIGNIGVAMDVAEKYFPSLFIPLLIGFPTLNRFVVFGNLFARIRDTVYRLDRHPVMSNHPVTPMQESDVRRHLQRQMDREMALVDVIQLEKLDAIPLNQLIFNENSEDKVPLLLFDTLKNDHLIPIGKWIEKNSLSSHQLLLGSSAVEYALGHVYGAAKDLKIESISVTPILVVSGSCAQTTADQILHVEKLGFTCIRIAVDNLFSIEFSKQEMERVTDAALSSLKSGHHTVIYSALGPDDPMVKTTLKQQHAQPQWIAHCQAEITGRLLEAFPLKRLVTAGGDTSGYILKKLKISALEFSNILAPGAPLCQAHAENPAVDGMEIAIKGGQNGTVRYFEFAQKGGVN